MGWLPTLNKIPYYFASLVIKHGQNLRVLRIIKKLFGKGNKKNLLLKEFILTKRIPPIYRDLLRGIKYDPNQISKLGFIGYNVVLEACSKCQLHCRLCLTGRGLSKWLAHGWGYLKFKDFKEFVEKNPNVKQIEIAHAGEIFLNPDLKKIIQYAFLKGVRLTAHTGTNMNSISEDMIKCLVKYKFDAITMSIDGASNKTYKIYRRGGDFERVISNIRRINHFKTTYKSEFPYLTWQFIIFGHNEHEIPIARRLAGELGMGFKTVLNHSHIFFRVRDKEWVRREESHGIASRKEYEKKYRRMYHPACLQLWTSPYINWDGKLLGCCNNIWEAYGNVFQTSFNECLKSEKYLYAKRMLLGLEKPRKDIPCYKCKVYYEIIN